MTHRTQFEQMLDMLINEDVQGAKAMFHEIVVAKSRDIYESLLDDEMEEGLEMEAIGGDQTDSMIDDLESPDDFDSSDEGDDYESDDLESDFEDDMDGGDDDPATKDDIMDIKDALEDLKAEFEAMLNDTNVGEDDDEEESEEEDEEEFDFGSDEESEEDEDEQKNESVVREYTEKVPAPKHGDNGANAKSVVAGKNNMGGTSANIARGGVSNSGGTKGGLASPEPKHINSGNVNVPGAKKASKLHAVSKPKGGDNGANTKSTLGH